MRHVGHNYILYMIYIIYVYIYKLEVFSEIGLVNIEVITLLFTEVYTRPVPTL